MNTPPNVIMKSTSPSELAWLLAGVVYPADADEWPEIFIFDSKKASQQDLTPDQLRWVNARVIAAKFIQKLLSKVCEQSRRIRMQRGYDCGYELDIIGRRPPLTRRFRNCWRSLGVTAVYQ